MSGREDYPHSGYSNGTSREMPADLAAVQADDALLDMLGAADHIPHETDDELTRLMAAWRREIHADSDRVLVDTNTALAVINAARRPVRRRNPVFGTIAAAAAVLVIAFSTVGLVAKSAKPGDQLWGVTQVLYSNYAESVEAAAVVREELDEAKTAIQQGNREKARNSLKRIEEQLPVIAEAEGKTELAVRHHDLQKEIEKAVSPEPDWSTDSSEPRFPAGLLAPQSSTTSAPTTTIQPNPAAVNPPTSTTSSKPTTTTSTTTPTEPVEPTSPKSSPPKPPEPPQPPMIDPGSSSNSSGSDESDPSGFPHEFPGDGSIPQPPQEP